MFISIVYPSSSRTKKNNKKKWKLCCEAWNPKSKLIDTNKGQMDIGCHITSHFIFKICYDVSEDKSSPEFRSFRDNIYCLLSKRYNHTLKYDVVMKHRRRIIVHWKLNRLIVVRFKQKKKIILRSSVYTVILNLLGFTNLMTHYFDVKRFLCHVTGTSSTTDLYQAATYNISRI